MKKKGYSVMIVDDNEIDNFISRKVLQEADFSDDILVMNSGVVALEYIQEHKNKLEKLPNIIFLDLNMPIVDGFVFLFEFSDFAQQVKDHCKIIVLSSLLEQQVIDKILKNEHVLDFIPKPLTVNSLYRVEHKIPLRV